jgi:hypothetical protein
MRHSSSSRAFSTGQQPGRQQFHVLFRNDLSGAETSPFYAQLTPELIKLGMFI